MLHNNTVITISLPEMLLNQAVHQNYLWCSFILARTRSLHTEREQSATLPTPHKGREVKVAKRRKKGHGTPAWSPALQQAPGQALTVSQSGTFANTCGKSRRRLNPWVSAQAFINLLGQHGSWGWGPAHICPPLLARSFLNLPLGERRSSPGLCAPVRRQPFTT